MDASSRQTNILSLLESQGSCSIQTLSTHFNVSCETIRRDVKQLGAQGFVQKVHGSVRLPINQIESPYRQRVNEYAEQKQSIAKEVSALIPDNAVIAIESGTTTFWVARALQHKTNLTVITNGLEVARELSGRNGNHVYLAGGEVFESTMSSLGAATLEFIGQFAFDIAIISASALNAEHGLCDAQLAEAEIGRVMARKARHVIAIVDSSKFDQQAHVNVCGIEEVDVLVTDAQPSKSIEKLLGKLDIIVAGQA